MSNRLEPIWDAYQTASHALKVARRCATQPAIEEERPFRNTRFHRLSQGKVTRLLDDAQSELDDVAVLSLYAAFEAHLRAHLARQSRLLGSVPGAGRSLRRALAKEFAAHCDRELAMDRIAKLFADAVGDALVADVVNIRKFRHWVAHGRRRRSTHSPVPPLHAYRALSAFLVSAKLV